jgi:hypothetical protein
MSWLDDVVSFGKEVVTGSTVGGRLARSAIASVVLRQVNKSAKKDNEAAQPVDQGVREQVDADTNNSVPVVYGQAFVSGKITDAVLTNGNRTMWYCLTICEKTGLLINGTPSVITIDKVYWDQNEVRFQADGITASSVVSEEGVANANINGLVKIYLYNAGSSNQTYPLGYSGANTPAYNIFPNWTANHTMSDLVFALIRVDYNADRGFTGIGNIEFRVTNTMTQAGDVLYDYLRNPRYGAGIADEEIKSS